MAGKAKYPTVDSAKSGTTAYQQMNQSQIGANIYDPNNPATQPYLAYINSTDATAKQIAWQKLYRGWVASNDMAPQGSAYRNNFEYLQTILRGLGLSKGKTAIGVLDPQGQDQSALANVLKGAIGMNLSVPAYLDILKNSGAGTGSGAPKQLDTTTKYNKQISTALKLKDAQEAAALFTDSYFKMFGRNPSAELSASFGQAWNAEAKRQTTPTTTESITTYQKVYDTTKPILDPKTKKPKLGADGKPMYQQKSVNGVLQWEPVTKYNTLETSEGFTSGEQDKFLAEYLVANFPKDNFDTKTLGGAAKSIYDSIAALHKNNYSDVPDFSTVAGTVKSMLSTTDAAVSKEVLDQYAKKVRDNVATRFMSLADWVNAGNDASEKINPLLSSASQFLESDVTVKDDLMKKILNFQGSDGTYRLPNDYELNQLLVNDPRYAKTSTAKNESINAAQALTSRLRLG